MSTITSRERSTATSTCFCQQPSAFEPCLFLQDGDQKAENRGEQVLVFGNSLVKFCETTDFQPETVVAVAWSLLLRYFVGQSEVAFDFTHLDEELEGHSCMITSVLQGESTVNDLLDTFEQSFASIECDCSPTSDTRKNAETSRTWDTSVIFHTILDSDSLKDAVKPHAILELHVCLNHDFCTCLISYDISKISKARGREIARTLQRIAESMFSNPHLPISQVNHFTEYQRRIFDIRLKNTPSPSKHLLHELMESHALTSPNSLAVCGWDRNFTYEQLKEHSSRLAHHLRSLGIGTGTIVPILSVKSAWVPVAILGVLKAGAAILVMDPSHPAERLGSIIALVNAKVVICSRCPAKVEEVVFPAIETLVYICDIPELPDVPKDAKAFKMVDNTSPAYIIFTSGSTGIPKGVVIDHSAIVTSSLGFGSAMKITPETRMLQFAAHSFDISILEMCTALVLGATVCIPSEEERLNDIAGVMEKMQVNYAVFTPTVARLIHPDNVPTLKNLCLCGEPVQVDNVARWAERVNLFMGYGPAETSILCTMEQMTIDSNPKYLGAPIGFSAWIVNHDDENLLCPDGTPGELVIMGPVCGIEYLRDPEKTAKSFINQPKWFHDNASSPPENWHRLYKTGDSAYCKPDGTLMIVGRRDNQIKLHGQRIELGEVEFNLRQVFPDQSNIIVDLISPGGDESNKQLAAFVVLPKGGNGEDSEDLDQSLLPFLEKIRNDVLSRLPKYMIPSVFIPIASMPETISKKADRKALRSLGSAKTLHEIAAYNGIERSHRDPTTAMDKLLQILLIHTLNLKTSEISMNDSFFVLGGDSIKAMLLVAAARKVGFSISVNDIFATSKLSELVLTMREIEDTSTISIEPFSIIKTAEANRVALAQIKNAGISDKDVEDYYPTTAEQDRVFRQTLTKPKSHIMVFPFKLGPEIDSETLRQAWDRVVEVHPVLRTRILSFGDSASLQVVMKETIQWQDLDGGIESAKPLLVGFGTPLASWSITKSKVDGEDRFFVFTIHHALIDGWSFALLWNAVAYAYEHSKALSIPASFNALIKYYESRDQAATENFWRSELANAHATTLLTWPSKAYTPYQTHRMETQVLLPNKIVNSNITMCTILEVSFAITLSSYERSNDITFRTTGTGRTQPVASLLEILGAVLTSFPVRIQLNHTESLTTLLNRVQTHSLQTSPYEYLGIENISNLTDNTNGIVCDSNSPYLIIQPEDIGSCKEGLEGMTKLPMEWVPSQTPLSVCCILKDGGTKMKIATGFDRNMIEEKVVRCGILPRFEAVVKEILRSLSGGEGDVKVGGLMNAGVGRGLKR